ncbi:hypothetical protein V1Y59_07425 [Gordonia sp. PKS22-38]|uniref:Uncharacterized protein n=1 Tax=Gordonia prachuapensis TaxID=3115651 RepID=A0ABU7MRG7_9ACTN|nr:hypothetical protein [Gordonia sp. PKS22-38]
MTTPGARGHRWWDRRLFGHWMLINGLAYAVIVVGGASLEQIASGVTLGLAVDHRGWAILLVAIIGAAVQGAVLGRWQWRVLVTRVPGLAMRRWVIATFMPALVVWLLVIAPAAVDMLADGGETLMAFRDGFVQAVVLGPLIGLSQAGALRGHTTRWPWWFAASITTYAFGAAAYQVGRWLLSEVSILQWATPSFPLLGFVIYGLWMLWVTAEEATVNAPRSSSNTAG